ncbi:hypothetical protein [Vibrio panuliri]|uniref:Uncharacterized protein n=1 Tax=Vibrio panuliri TaxID=1381081 RepID=A0ABX3FLK3_9VIBR|nr:hypothetical protein [Vibrio panuliri]KAB1458038.1 hypothetical protein F7O85_10005 [Vibrio panuliri]OLQ95081.1 hypothetical protein BIY20_06965 [Vibrio panuliri]
MFRKLGLISAVCVCLSAPVAASYQLEHLEPLDHQELASYRGGFLGDDFLINIGLDIATSINGERLFNNRIANLFFQNGRLVASQPEVVPTTTVVQVGSGNTTSLIPSVEPSVVAPTPEPATPANTASVPVETTPAVEPPQITVSQISAPLPSITQSAINRVIQNSLDDTVIGFETAINIDAQVNGALRRLERSNKIQQSLQFNFN